MEWYNRNSSNRTPLDKHFTTIKFKVLFPSFDIWKANLLNYQIHDKDITEDIYIFLNDLIGNSYLKHATGSKNKVYIAMSYQSNLFKYKKDTQLANKTLDENLDMSVQNESSFYTINKSMDNAKLNIAEYIDHKVINKTDSKIAIIDRLNEIMKFNKMNEPKIVFINRLINNMLLPLQPNQNGNLY